MEIKTTIKIINGLALVIENQLIDHDSSISTIEYTEQYNRNYSSDIDEVDNIFRKVNIFASVLDSQESIVLLNDKEISTLTCISEFLNSYADDC